MSCRTLAWVTAGILGIALTAAITWEASRLASQRIGLASQPLSVTRQLAPPASPRINKAPEPQVDKRTVARRHPRETHVTAPASSTTAPVRTPVASATPVPPRRHHHHGGNQQSEGDGQSSQTAAPPASSGPQGAGSDSSGSTTPAGSTGSSGSSSGNGNVGHSDHGAGGDGGSGTTGASGSTGQRDD